jgi:threonine/homoserine/homoserine lactone efflux protein
VEARHEESSEGSSVSQIDERVASSRSVRWADGSLESASITEDRVRVLHTPTVAIALAGLGLGIALGGAPGPVQAVLLTEAVRGGLGRGFRAQAGANLTFGLMLIALALGVSLVPPRGAILRLLEIAGGAFLLWLAWDGFRSQDPSGAEAGERRQLPPAVRGVIAVVLNPGAWLFLATAASSLLVAASQQGGTSGAMLAALALLTGVVLSDGGVVLLGGLGLRRTGERFGRYVRRGLAIVLAALGIWLLIRAVIP